MSGARYHSTPTFPAVGGASVAGHPHLTRLSTAGRDALAGRGCPAHPRQQASRSGGRGSWIGGVVAGSVVAAVVAGGVGAVAGRGARQLLARMARGVVLRGPWCELAVAVAWAATGAAWGGGWLPGGWLPALLGLGWLGSAVAAVDLRHHRIPDALTLPALPLALLCVLPLGVDAAGRAVGGAALAAAAHAAVHLLARRAMGAGDVKLAAPLGAVLGAAAWPAVPLAALLAGVLTAGAGAVGLATGALRRGAGVPHGPSMVAAACLITTWLATTPTGLSPPG
jgi:leader peptidase (prepilin peptidase)/N-methyltransferase